MVAAYEGGMRELNFSSPEDPGAETLAKTIVALAKQGERNPIRLQQWAIEALSGTPRDATGSLAVCRSSCDDFESTGRAGAVL
jgi:hypothetical protein